MKISHKDTFKTILVITIGMLLIHLIFSQDWALYLAVFIGLSAIISTFLATKIEWAWMKLAWVLSKIIPNIILALIFYLVLTPVALLSRLFGEPDPLKLKNNSDSIYRHSNKVFEKSTFEKPW